MTKVIYNYSKCRGMGDCVDVCPFNLLELSKNRKWCKPKDVVIANTEAVEMFHNKVENNDGRVDISIEYKLRSCRGCRICQTVCPVDAISILGYHTMSDRSRSAKPARRKR